MIELLAQIKADGSKPFTAGITLHDDVVIEAAPIIKYMKGWKRDSVRSYCKERKWEVVTVTRRELDADSS